MTFQGRRTRAKVRLALAAGLLTSTTFLVSPASAAINVMSDPILYWNDIAITLATAFSPGGAPAQARAYAMVNIAMHDAVNATQGNRDRSYLSGVATPGGDQRAAAAQAAHDVLVALNPTNTAAYDTALTNSLALIGGGSAKTNGIATGAAYAAAMLANRVGDGASTAGGPAYVSTNLPGDYRLTPGVAAAALPGWGNVKPFLLSSGDLAGLDPGPPPALTSAAYAADYNEVKEIGALNSTTRTADQTASALFWDISNGGTWIRAGLVIAEDEGLDTLGFSRVFSTLAMGISDASIAVFDAKYDYRLWRPITAIQNGGIDGNPLTTADPTWNSLFAAPGHPSYISGHSAISAVSSTILQSFFGDDEAFQFDIGTDRRKFTSLSQAELDAANSRLWGGIHFRFDNDAGLSLGRQAGARILSLNAFGAVPEGPTWAMMIAGFACVGIGLRVRRRAVGVTYG